MNRTNNIQGTFETFNKPKLFELKFDVLKPCTVEVTLSDPENPNTAYTVRVEDFTYASKQNWIMKLPITSKYMVCSLKIQSGAIDEYISMKQLSIEDYRVPKNHFSKEVAAFYEVVNKFCAEAGYLETGKTYHSEDEKYQIEYLDFIPDGHGGIHPTPARIHNTDNYIQVSAYHFRPKPIDRRVAIMSHEIAHNFVNSNPDSEEQADMNGAMLFDQLGWNDYGYVMGFTKTFEKAMQGQDMHNASVAHNNAVNYSRARKIINRYNRKKLLRA